MPLITQRKLDMHSRTFCLEVGLPCSPCNVLETDCIHCTSKTKRHLLPEYHCLPKQLLTKSKPYLQDSQQALRSDRAVTVLLVVPGKTIPQQTPQDDLLEPVHPTSHLKAST